MLEASSQEVQQLPEEIKKEPFRVTPIYDKLLRGSQDMPIGLYHLYMAKAEQLCRLHYSPGSIKAIKARLRKLADEHYVQDDAIPTKFYRSPYYYALDYEGVRYLGHAGLDMSESFRASKEVDKHALFVEHTLELNDVIIAAALLKRAAPGYYLDSFIHERTLKLAPYKAVWRGGKFSLIPDAFLDFRLSLPAGGQRRMPVLLEHDRGSEEQKYFRRRIRAYITMLKAEAYKSLFNVGTITVAFTTFAGKPRMERMREWTRQELALTNEPQAIGMAFCFASLAQPLEPRNLWLEPCWLAAYEGTKPIALLAGE
jgi:hypothetical protein